MDAPARDAWVLRGQKEAHAARALATGLGRWRELHKRREAGGPKPPTSPAVLAFDGHSLLQLRLATRLADLLHDRLRVGLGDALLDRFGCTIDQVFRLLEAETGHCPNDLDHVHLVVASTGEHDRELS